MASPSKRSRRTPGRPRRSSCPVSTVLDIVGDKWSLLVVRDLMFSGLRTFKEFMASEEGIASNVLAERLERLECEGIIRRDLDPADARRASYALTCKGVSLAPVLIEMILWAARHENTAAPPALVRLMQRDRAAFIKALPRRLK